MPVITPSGNMVAVIPLTIADRIGYPVTHQARIACQSMRPPMLIMVGTPAGVSVWYGKAMKHGFTGAEKIIATVIEAEVDGAQNPRLARLWGRL